MPWDHGQPDQNLLMQLYGPQPSSDPYDVVLTALQARRKCLDGLILLLEMEGPKLAETGDVT